MLYDPENSYRLIGESDVKDRIEGRGATLRERFWDRALRAVARGNVLPYLAAATAALTVATGFLVTLIAHKDFPTFEDGIWFALQTLTTVGYGDIVPHSAWGRVVGAVVMVVGVTFLSYLTAVVTSLLISARQSEQAADAEARRAAGEEETRALLRQLLARLDAIEGKLDNRPDA